MSVGDASVLDNAVELERVDELDRVELESVDALDKEGVLDNVDVLKNGALVCIPARIVYAYISYSSEGVVVDRYLTALSTVFVNDSVAFRGDLQPKTGTYESTRSFGGEKCLTQPISAAKLQPK